MDRAVRILSEDDLRSVAGIDQPCLDAVAEAFAWLAQGKADMPPIMHISAREHHGDIDVKGAYVAGIPTVAIKIASGFFDNPARGLPAGNAMMVLLSAETGFCQAVLLDNGYLTDLRTGLAGTVAARYLAAEQVATVGVLGTGVQARYQVRCLALERAFTRVLVWGRNPDRVNDYIRDMQHELGGQVQILSASREQAVRQSQVVYTTTPSTTPLLEPDWLQPGALLCAVGADFPGKQELHPDVLRRADRVVCDRLSQCLHNGELQHLAQGGRLPIAVDELGELVTGEKPPREDETQVIVCDLTGTGVQDTAIANLAYQRAVQDGLGAWC